jgi:hypothetical protein
MSVVQMSLRCRGHPSPDSSNLIEGMHRRRRPRRYTRLVPGGCQSQSIIFTPDCLLLPNVILTSVKVIASVCCLTLIDDSSTKGSRSASGTLQSDYREDLLGQHPSRPLA